MIKKERKELLIKNDIYDLCCERNWFNAGTNRQYDYLFEMVDCFNECTMQKTRDSFIYNMACWILQHTTKDSLDGFKTIDIMNAISNLVHIIYVKKETL